MRERPDRLSPPVATLTYGQQVLALPKKSPAILGDWTKVRLDKDRLGYVKDSVLGTPKILETLQGLRQSLEGVEPQASGVTTTPAYLRLEPGRQGTPLEKLPVGTRFEMFQRQATLQTSSSVLSSAGPPRKDIWYKIRLPDNRVGYLYTKNFKFEPPAEISKYTQNRRIIAWLKLKTVTGQDFGSVSEYLVAYATPDEDFGADFDRLEAYSWDGKGYQTAFFLRSLRGILPIRVIRQNEEIAFEFKELDPEHKDQVTEQRYLYAHPYKKVGSTPMPGDVGLH